MFQLLPVTDIAFIHFTSWEQCSSQCETAGTAHTRLNYRSPDPKICSSECRCQHGRRKCPADRANLPQEQTAGEPVCQLPHIQQAAGMHIEPCACRFVSSPQVASGFSARQLCTIVQHWTGSYCGPSCQLCRQADCQGDHLKLRCLLATGPGSLFAGLHVLQTATYSLAVPQELYFHTSGMTD